MPRRTVARSARVRPDRRRVSGRRSPPRRRPRLRLRALEQQPRHLAFAARAPFEDRAQRRTPCGRRTAPFRRQRRRRPSGSARRGRARCGPRRSAPASVWQRLQECENSSRPFCWLASRCTPPTPTLALCSALKRQHQRRHDQAEGAHHHERRGQPPLRGLRFGGLAPSAPRTGTGACQQQHAQAERQERRRATTETSGHAAGTIYVGGVGVLHRGRRDGSSRPTDSCGARVGGGKMRTSPSTLQDLLS